MAVPEIYTYEKQMKENRTAEVPLHGAAGYELYDSVQFVYMPGDEYEVRKIFKWNGGTIMVDITPHEDNEGDCIGGEILTVPAFMLEKMPFLEEGDVWKHRDDGHNALIVHVSDQEWVNIAIAGDGHRRLRKKDFMRAYEHHLD